MAQQVEAIKLAFATGMSQAPGLTGRPWQDGPSRRSMNSAGTSFIPAVSSKREIAAALQSKQLAPGKAPSTVKVSRSSNSTLSRFSQDSVHFRLPARSPGCIVCRHMIVRSALSPIDSSRTYVTLCRHPSSPSRRCRGLASSLTGHQIALQLVGTEGKICHSIAALPYFPAAKWC